ncbi:MAG: hypothetical protein HOP12_11895 [Candidatus Eisenbacteria bacterium]|uniref:Uncharacterized protein n=1 Tax=Eiseniibacteriota bacterium TaxID=2212470 RepID=A0A849SJS9_UNCEI|nr:hypothetical protein [Candidatus Eisenbacteria bacterium]
MLKSLVVFGFALACSSCGGASDSHSLNLDEVAGTPAFAMSDKLMGTVVRSSDRAEIGDKLAFVGLLSNDPSVLFESGMTSPLQKVNEDARSMTLLLVASGSGSVDAFVLDKQSGKFSRASTGMVGGVYASASVGTCK